MSGFFWTVILVCVWGSLQCCTFSCLSWLMLYISSIRPVQRWISLLNDSELLALSWRRVAALNEMWRHHLDGNHTIDRSIDLSGDSWSSACENGCALKIQHVNINPPHLPSAADPSRRRRQTGASRLPRRQLNVTGNELWTRRWQRLTMAVAALCFNSHPNPFYMKTSHVGGVQTRCQERNAWSRRAGNKSDPTTVIHRCILCRICSQDDKVLQTILISGNTLCLLNVGLNRMSCVWSGFFFF